MRRHAAITTLAALALLGLPAAVSCRPKPRVPAWIQAAPADSLVAFSGEAGWMLTQKDLQSFLARDPMVERALDLFLQKAHINPRTESGRVTFHVIGMPQKGDGALQKNLDQVLVQLNQFKDPAALVAALSESFPQEGTLRLQGRDWPLHVILDLETSGMKAHIRAASDEKGQVWIGALESLNRLAGRGSLAATPDVTLAAEWISPGAPFQGYLQPEALLAGIRQHLEGSMLKDLPQGVGALLWSITPAEKDQPIRFELALAGTPEGINQVSPWLQRLVAAANAVQSAPGAQAPELMQEKRRIGLRCALTADQLKLVMEKLGQPGLSFKAPKA